MGMTQAKKYKIKKLDRRMGGYMLFSHRVVYYWNEDFLRARHWMFEMFGPSCELELYEVNKQLGLGYSWSWRSDNSRRELYLTQEQLSAFILYNT